MTYEAQFKAEYPHARHTSETVSGSLKRYTVYAGDYLCAEACTKERAYKLALQYAHDGLITPDPEEVAYGMGGGGHVVKTDSLLVRRNIHAASANYPNRKTTEVPQCNSAEIIY